MKETTIQRIPKSAEIGKGIRNYLERRKPNMEVGEVADINFGEMYDKYGITTYLFDRDGTITDYHSSRVSKRVKENIAKGRQELHARGVDLQLGIMTNTPPSDEASFVGLNYVAAQVDAEIVLVPESRRDRKPSQIMPLKGISFFHNKNGTKPSEVAVVGDKLTADVLAADNTGLFSIRVDHKKMGDRDHVGDKWTTRHQERGLSLALREVVIETEFPLMSAAAHRAIAEVPHGSEDSLEQVVFESNHKEKESALIPDWVSEEIRPLWDNSLIAGFGAKSITLPQEVLDEIPPTWHSVLFEKATDAIETVDPHFRDRTAAVGSTLNSVVENYGGDIADALADYRSKIAGPAAAVAILNDKNTQATAWALSAAATDFIDGWLARHSRRGATPEGAKKDNEADKEVSRILNEALLIKYPEHQKAFDAILASDDTMTNVDRPEMQKEGIETPAVEPGKEAEAINLATKIFLMTPFAERHPMARRLAIRYAKNKKEGRRDASKKIWRQEHEELIEGKAVLLTMAEAA